jgi:hypothetical protein
MVKTPKPEKVPVTNRAAWAEAVRLSIEAKQEE